MAKDGFFLGGDRYHPSEVAFSGVGAVLEDLGLQVEYTTDWTALNADMLATKKLLVILRDGMNWPNGFEQPYVQWMSDDQQQAIWDFVHRGGGFLPLHNAQGYYPAGGRYYELFGGDYGGHPASAIYSVRVVNRDHPITAGVEDYQIYDEQHMVKYYLGPEHELLRSISADGEEAAAGWWQEIGQGRMAYLSMGHTPESLEHPMTKRLLGNAVRWCLKLE
jgi:type 1 glutamine amidotransferase